MVQSSDIRVHGLGAMAVLMYGLDYGTVTTKLAILTAIETT